tara:strand:- start:43 stop:498 length:456 start_codon:yes stop_codon:yes gene_type:complete
MQLITHMRLLVLKNLGVHDALLEEHASLSVENDGLVQLFDHHGSCCAVLRAMVPVCGTRELQCVGALLTQHVLALESTHTLLQDVRARLRVNEAAMRAALDPADAQLLQSALGMREEQFGQTDAVEMRAEQLGPADALQMREEEAANPVLS